MKHYMTFMVATALILAFAASGSWANQTSDIRPDPYNVGARWDDSSNLMSAPTGILAIQADSIAPSHNNLGARLDDAFNLLSAPQGNVEQRTYVRMRWDGCESPTEKTC